MTARATFRPGDAVRVFGGRFTGQRGEVVYVGPRRLTVKLVDPLGYAWHVGASVRVGAGDVRREDR